MKDKQYLDGFIGELLHINEVGDNKLIDLGANGGSGTYVLSHTCIDLSAYALSTIAERIGKTGNTLLLNSAKAGGEQRVNRHKNTFEWKSFTVSADVTALHVFIENARKELILRGNNPLFLSVGALKWRVAVKERGKDVLKDVTSPLLIFPVKLIVSANSAPVAIEFIEDEIYVNPCLIAKLEQVFGQDIAQGLPKVGGRDNSLPVDLALLGDGTEYFKAVAEYINGCNQTDGFDKTRFEFDKDFIAIAQYKHDEICTYYDIRRNKDKIYSHPLVARLFEKSSPEKRENAAAGLPAFILPRDSVQEKIITKIVNGESLIVKGPPGTGKTVTIANAIAALLAENKRVLFASKKISALTEVYAKLPERLRKFVMLLDSETEKSAAKIRPEEIKTDFKRLLAEAKEYREPASLSANVNHATNERAKAMKWLSAYIGLTFNERGIAEDSFYAALDTVCKLDMPVINFADGKAVAGVTREQYNFAYSQVAEAQKCFEVLNGGGKFPVYKCPWFGIDLACDSESAMRLGEQSGKLAAEVLSRFETEFKELGLCAEEFTLDTVANAAICTLADGNIRAIAEREDRSGKLGVALAEFAAVPESKFGWKQKPEAEEIGRRALRLDTCDTPDGLTFAQIKTVVENADVLKIGGEYLSADAVTGLNKFFASINDETKEAERRILRACEVFKSDLGEAELALIKQACEVLKKYFGGAEKPNAFDFKAKGIYKKLCALSFLKAPSFKDIAGAIKEYGGAFALFDSIEKSKETLNKMLHRKLNEKEAECVKIVAERCGSAHTQVCAYVQKINKNYEFLCECREAVNDGDGLATAEDIRNLYVKEYRLNLLKAALADYGETVGGKEEEIARSILSAVKFTAACKAQGANTDTAIKAINVLRKVKEIKRGVDDTVKQFEEFGAKFFRNYYAIHCGDVTFADCKILHKTVSDREVIAAAAKYTAIKHNPVNALNIAEFLYWFEKGGLLPDGATFADAFEQSYFSLAVEEKLSGLGIMRNGLGATAENNLSILNSADEKLSELNAQVIESKCISRIKPADDDFIFVQDRNPNENLRLMFKRHARAILKLKKCMILSPYTASLLFGEEEFENFDVLIVDEASQLEPALVLPVLFRSKQCVIVGDEWQMPPIKHFTVLSPVQETDDGEGYSALEPEISVLGLALRNEGFSVEELICHYRSKTEALIKYSQEKFYPNMRTFPAPIPAREHGKGALGLGLKDVYVEDGVVSAGRNEREAEQVVKELKTHFDNYYDEKNHTLAMSVGVVSFGEAQCSLIESKVKADSKLYGKIMDALEHFDDLPEKLVFFKTIETVQGQETGHLILSITHGKRESGLYMHFGQLNQGKLGRCIFNVAVTRAQYAVTVVHSVKAREVKGSVDYIGEYLETVERFADVGRGQFVCERAEKGFVGEVAKFIESKGVSPERIVINYGVTDGSVRIPVAVLDKDLKSALLGVWCEKPAGGRYDFIDLNMRYKKSLERCGWKIHSVSIYDWVDNGKNERKALEKALASILKEEENN